MSQKLSRSNSISSLFPEVSDDYESGDEFEILNPEVLNRKGSESKINNQYSNINFDVSEEEEKLSSFLKEIISKKVKEKEEGDIEIKIDELLLKKNFKDIADEVTKILHYSEKNREELICKIKEIYPNYEKDRAKNKKIEANLRKFSLSRLNSISKSTSKGS